MTAFWWAAALACAWAGLRGAYAAGRRAERLERLREEVGSYERLESIRRRVDGLPDDGLINVLRSGGRKK